MHLNLETVILKSGAHSADSGEACVMEMCACLAGETWSDSPKCVSPAISAFMRRWNDCLNDSTRQRLKELVPVVMNTATTQADEVARSYLAIDWFIRVHVPAWLDLAGLKDEANAVRQGPEITEEEVLTAALPRLVEAQKKASAAWGEVESEAWSAAEREAWSASWIATWGATERAAESAAWSAVDSETESEAWSEAWSASWIASRSAAEIAAWIAASGAVESEARSAAESVINPTVATLQESAMDLVRRMAAIGRKP